MGFKKKKSKCQPKCAKRANCALELTFYLQVPCATQGLEDVVGKESRRREAAPSEAVSLQDVADDGGRQFGHRGNTSTCTFMDVGILEEVSGIDTLRNQMLAHHDPRVRSGETGRVSSDRNSLLANQPRHFDWRARSAR